MGMKTRAVVTVSALAAAEMLGACGGDDTSHAGLAGQHDTSTHDMDSMEGGTNSGDALAQQLANDPAATRLHWGLVGVPVEGNPEYNDAHERHLPDRHFSADADTGEVPYGSSDKGSIHVTLVGELACVTVAVDDLSIQTAPDLMITLGASELSGVTADFIDLSGPELCNHGDVTYSEVVVFANRMNDLEG